MLCIQAYLDRGYFWALFQLPVVIIVVKILNLAVAQCKIMTYIIPTHVKISIEPDIRELFLNFITIISTESLVHDNHYRSILTFCFIL
jgi:hypothetical protein